MPSGFFIRFSLSALRYRKQRLLLAFGALAVAAALATVMFGIFASVAQRIRDEFSSYGANLVAVAVDGGIVPLTIVDAAKREGAQATPLLITIGHLGERVVPVAGMIDPYSYWHVQGSSAIGPGKCLAGETLASQLSLHAGATLTVLDDKGVGQPCLLSGIVSSGGAEDGELIIDFESAAALAGIHGAATLVEILAPEERLESIR